MAYETILFEVENGIGHVTLNRPAQMNAFNEAMIGELRSVLKEAADDRSIRVLVLSGAGKAFSAGGDLKAMQAALQSDNPAEFFEAPLAGLNEVVTGIRSLAKPVLACIHGFASGAGFNLALACDLRIAAKSTRFNQAFVKLGLVPDTGGTYLLPRIVGLAKATELLFTGDFLDAEEAKRLGLVHRCVPDDELEARTQGWARELAAAPTRALGKIKMLLQMSYQLTFDAQAELERTTQIEIARESQDFREGVRAFLEKRPPDFQGE